MIEVTLRFTTDSIGAKGQIIPKHANAVCFVFLPSNPLHGIAAKPSPRVANSFAEIPLAIERALLDHGIVLHPSPREKRLRRS